MLYLDEVLPSGDSVAVLDLRVSEINDSSESFLIFVFLVCELESFKLSISLDPKSLSLDDYNSFD